MARRRRPRRRRSRGGITILIGAGLIVVALAAFGGIGWALWRATDGPAIDEASLCPETGPAGQLAILLDTTDPVAPAQLRTARAQVERLVTEAPDFTRVSFATVSPEQGVREESFRSLCKPPSDASALTGNPRLVAERYDETFLDPVTAHLDALLAIPTAESSPIVEALAEFLAAIPGFRTGEGPREVVLVSDLVQHSDVLSFYRGGDWASFAAAGNVERLSGALDGAEVRILRLPRPEAPAEVVDDFWVRYLDAQGAARVRTTVLGDL